MMLAVIGAMDEEVRLLHQSMEDVDENIHAGLNVYRGTFKGTQIVLAKCGIGKVNATICSQMLIDLYRPDALVFTGVAGGLLPNMKVGDLVIGSHVIQYDMDLTVFGRRHGEVPGQNRMVESDPKMVSKCATAFDEAFEGVVDGPRLMLGTIVSGDRFIADTAALRWLQREFSALATEMEGAAVGYTCKLNNVPFVVVRGLSDTAGETASGDFSANLHVVCANSYRLLECLIPEFA
jgi:adenosylhomocysteine nucleosidase